MTKRLNNKNHIHITCCLHIYKVYLYIIMMYVYKSLTYVWVYMFMCTSMHTCVFVYIDIYTCT